MTTAVADRTLTAADRCDRCGAQAYVRVVLESSGGELLFCAHHGRQYEDKLREVAIVIHDESNRLSETRAETHAETSARAVMHPSMWPYDN